MANELTITIPIPTHIAGKAEIVQEGGIYFGTNWTFTTTSEAGRHILFAAISDMIRDWSRERRENDPRYAVEVNELLKRLLSLG